MTHLHLHRRSTVFHRSTWAEGNWSIRDLALCTISAPGQRSVRGAWHGDPPAVVAEPSGCLAVLGNVADWRRVRDCGLTRYSRTYGYRTWSAASQYWFKQASADAHLKHPCREPGTDATPPLERDQYEDETAAR